MALQECGNGHVYDTDQYSSCPYCSTNNTVINFDTGSNMGSIGKTVAAGMAPPTPTDNVGSTIAPQSYVNRREKEKKDDDIGKTVGVFKKRLSFEPVVGWLVCVKGPEKGKDYHIFGKNNTIGRSESMDICIKGDPTISRENHARLAYDEKHNAFHLIPAESTNTIYLNDEPVYIPTKLTSRDIIEFGDCQFIFVPLCDDSFKWGKENKDNDSGE